MSARMITYDEIELEILCRHDLSMEDRKEALLFIRDFRLEVAKRIGEEMIPEHLKDKLSIKLT